MSLSYRGSQRSSLSLGYTSSSPSTCSSNSRPLSTYSSTSGRLDYSAGSSGYGRLDYRSRTDLPSVTRTGLFTASSVSGSRSSSSYGDTSVRRTSYSGCSVGSSSHSESGSRKSLGDARPAPNHDVASSLESIRQRRRSLNVSGRHKIDDENVVSDNSVGGTRRRLSEKSSSLDQRRERRRESLKAASGRGRENSSSLDKPDQSAVSDRNCLSREDQTDCEVDKRNNSNEHEKGETIKRRLSGDKLGHECQKMSIKDNFNAQDSVKVQASDRGDVIQKPQIAASPPDKRATSLACRSEPEPANDCSAAETTVLDKPGPPKHSSAPRFPTGQQQPKTRLSASEHQPCFSTKDFSGISNVEEDGQAKGTGTVGELRSLRACQCAEPPKKPGVNGAIKVVGNSPRTNSSTTNASQAEVIRLESICEARTKELTHTKMQLRDTAQAFDTMAALLNYCCSDLNAFECPIVTRKLSSAQIQLSDYSCRLDELTLQKDDLNKILNQVIQEKEEALKKVEDTLSLLEKEREEHSKLTHEMDDTHNAALTTQRDELTSKHDETVKKLTQFYDRQIDMLRIAHDRQVSDVKNECKLEMNGVKICHLEEIQELRNKHDSQMEELHKQHRNKLEDITHRFESIKLTLSEKVESLRGECDELARRARVSEEALQRDADAKVQIALAPFISLPKEIDSLKTVLEMRNEEIQKLRTKTMDLEKQLEEIPIARDKIISLQQKVENLEAIINMKTDHEKQLHEKCQVLMRKYDRESRANKRLSMDYEQVMWRMSQSSEFGSSESLTRRHFSRSPPCSEEGSPDMRHRTLSPNCGQSDVVVRVKKRSSQSISEGDRKLRSRSATFVVEKYDSGDSHSPSSSPQLKQKRWRKKSQTDDIVAESRMCHSADAEILSNLPRQKHHGGQNDNLDAKDMAGSVMSCGDMTGSVASSGDMVSSYARSLSGDIANSYTRSLSAVSDSGMYDSMTRSDALDNSMASMDSEWGTSVNLSMNCGPAVDDLESSPPARNYHSLNVTVMPERHPSETDSGNVSCVTSSHEGSSNYQADIESIAGTKVQAEDQKNNGSYQFYITLPDEQALTDDSVFDKPIESGSL